MIKSPRREAASISMALPPAVRFREVKEATLNRSAITIKTGFLSLKKQFGKITNVHEAGGARCSNLDKLRDLKDRQTI